MKRNWINTLDAQITRFHTWSDWVKRESLRKGFLKWACLSSLFPQAKLQILIYKVQIIVKATLKKILILFKEGIRLYQSVIFPEKMLSPTCWACTALWETTSFPISENLSAEWKGKRIQFSHTFLLLISEKRYLEGCTKLVCGGLSCNIVRRLATSPLLPVVLVMLTIDNYWLQRHRVSHGLLNHPWFLDGWDRANPLICSRFL